MNFSQTQLFSWVSLFGEYF